MERPSGRRHDQLRPVRITRNYIRHAEGSVLVEFGDTRVICTASVDKGVPRFLRGEGSGWITAEYGENTLVIDCDVIQADGGTRTAAITGACVALVDALAVARRRRLFSEDPLRYMVAAVSVGVWNGQALLDLDYAEDSGAETDMNVIMTEHGDFVEVQGTAEGRPFRADELQQMLDIARKGTENLVRVQKMALAAQPA